MSEDTVEYTELGDTPQQALLKMLRAVSAGEVQHVFALGLTEEGVLVTHASDMALQDKLWLLELSKMRVIFEPEED